MSRLEIHFQISATLVMLRSMEKINFSDEQEKEKEKRDEYKELLATLLKQNSWTGKPFYLYQDIWYPEEVIKGLLLVQKHYKPQKTDIILASPPKSGTTWLKALAFSIVRRSHFSQLQCNPLLTKNPHDLVPFLEFGLCENLHKLNDLFHDRPRIFATQAAYDSLPSSILKDSDNKIVFICRHPLDQFMSLWFFTKAIPLFDFSDVTSASLEDAFEMYCQGISIGGPFWVPILGYWKASLERPDKVLFLKYEDLKENGVFYGKKLASFLGFPFSEEEEKQGLIEEMFRFCSFKNMKDYEANKGGTNVIGISNSAFFREGKVGDSLNHLSQQMVEKMEELIQEKIKDSGLSFRSTRSTTKSST